MTLLRASSSTKNESLGIPSGRPADRSGVAYSTRPLARSAFAAAVGSSSACTTLNTYLRHPTRPPELKTSIPVAAIHESICASLVEALKRVATCPLMLTRSPFDARYALNSVRALFFAGCGQARVDPPDEEGEKWTTTNPRGRCGPCAEASAPSAMTRMPNTGRMCRHEDFTLPRMRLKKGARKQRIVCQVRYNFCRDPIVVATDERMQIQPAICVLRLHHQHRVRSEPSDSLKSIRPSLVVISALLFVVASPAVARAQTGLVAAWGFNEGTGTTVADASGNNNTGTISGATWSTLGRYGNALSFNGTNNLVVVNSSASLNVTTAMTLSAWVFPTATQSGWRTIMQREVDAYFLNASNDAGPLRPAGGGTFNGTVRFVGGPTALAVNTWTHVALTYDGAAIRLFVNGTQVATAAQTGTLQTNASPLRIGGNVPYGEYFQGRLDEVRIYNRALSASEIQGDMAVGVSAGPPRLVIVHPAAGSVISSTTVNVAYTAAGDLTEVNHVHFQLDANPEVMDLTFDGAYQFTNVPVGSHVLSGYLVRADHSKILGTDASVSFSTAAQDVTPPSVAITAPAPGATLTGSVTVTADASDNSGSVAGVQFFADGNPLAPEVTTAPYSLSWNTVTASNGSHNLTARARDGSGNQTVSTQVAVTVANTSSTDPAVVGLWSQVINLPLVAIHTALMPNGKVLAWDDHTDGTGVGVFDPATLAVTTVPFLSANLFCAGLSLLSDGRVFVTGGNVSTHVGTNTAELFNPLTQTW